MVKFQKKKKKHPRKHSIDKLLYGLARSIGLPLWIRSVWTKGILMPFSLCRGRMNQNELDLCQRASCSGIRWPHISCEGQWKLSNKKGTGQEWSRLPPSRPYTIKTSTSRSKPEPPNRGTVSNFPFHEGRSCHIPSGSIYSYLLQGSIKCLCSLHFPR